MSQRPRTHWRRIVGGLLAVTIALAITTLVAVHDVMEASRAELHARIVGMNDSFRLDSFEAAAAHAQQITLAILASILAIAVLCIGSGLRLLLRGRSIV